MNKKRDPSPGTLFGMEVDCDKYPYWKSRYVPFPPLCWEWAASTDTPVAGHVGKLGSSAALDGQQGWWKQGHMGQTQAPLFFR